ncbi:dephospho-CoA kinase [Lentisphaera profundi]|uniref:Dephospho-CoA kinase n=1 Tax=Lentisphaera profundi TaxID=1658616 RepID=A0ABY7VP71_9BACT|nr:dephospho-CoA kinase [Lentisphaera profundi]WDE95482.1 dephospho-CoA kinase [Lentisphaera profundi]
MIKIGLTGGIGSGKSTALNFFHELGFSVQDCDDVVSEIYQSCEEFKKNLLGRFGQSIVTEGKIDKKKIAKLVFGNEVELKWLNKELHQKVRDEVKNNYQEEKINIVAVPLLHEAGWDTSFDATVCVWCPNDIRINRLKDRGFTPEESQARIAAQMSQDEKLERSGFAIINDFDIENLRAQCKELSQKFKNTYKNKDI